MKNLQLSISREHTNSDADCRPENRELIRKLTAINPQEEKRPILQN